MLIGYLVSGVDNDSYMYRGDAQPPRCPTCSFVLDHAWVDPSYKLRPGRSPDTSFTYDGRLIVSDNFRAAARRFEGATYVPLPSQPGWFDFQVQEAIGFDTERRKTKFSNFCDGCRRYTQVAGATPVFLSNPPVPLPDKFLRTDIEFGSGDELHPLVVVGPGLADALSGSRLRGLQLKGIDHSEPL